MNAKTRRETIALAVLLALLAVVLWWNLRPAGEPPAETATRQPRRAARRAEGQESGVVRVRLDALSAARPAPAEGGRNPFRFTPPPPPPMPSPQKIAGADGTGSAEGGPVEPPPPPPIPLRFIGLIGETAARRMAVLSDGNNVFYGREGDIIEGRYRILRIRLESIEMAYADGRGHQVVRRAGS